MGLTPRLLDDHLRIEVNLRGSLSNNLFANQGAIGSAVFFDPTHPVLSGKSDYGGYWEWIDDATGKANVLASKNPVALLNLRTDKSQVKRLIGNVALDYKFHFLPDLRANLNVAYDYQNGSGTVSVPTTAAAGPSSGLGTNTAYSQTKNNKTLQFYLNYVKEMGDNRLDLLAGYEYQDFLRENNFTDNVTKANNSYYKAQNTLVSFYGRLNYAFQNKYLFTATLRDDGSSRFSPATRWGLFPSAALAWKVSEEDFLKNSAVFSDLKIRVGYGTTGQQDVGNDYNYLARYTLSDPTAQYQFGSTFYNTLRPEGYDINFKWETTATYNAALDFGIKGGRLSGSVDFYLKKTSDLISFIPVPAGSNLTNAILTNVGSMENKGVELTLNATPLSTKGVNWDVNFNVTLNDNKITKLTNVDQADYQGVATSAFCIVKLARKFKFVKCFKL